MPLHISAPYMARRPTRGYLSEASYCEQAEHSQKAQKLHQTEIGGLGHAQSLCQGGGRFRYRYDALRLDAAAPVACKAALSVTGRI